MTGLHVKTEITGALEFFLRRPTRVARLMRAWPHTLELTAELLQAIELVCQANGVRPKDFTRRFDPAVSISAHARYVIIDLAEL